MDTHLLILPCYNRSVHTDSAINSFESISLHGFSAQLLSSFEGPTDIRNVHTIAHTIVHTIAHTIATSTNDCEHLHSQRRKQNLTFNFDIRVTVEMIMRSFRIDFVFAKYTNLWPTAEYVIFHRFTYGNKYLKLF